MREKLTDRFARTVEPPPKGRIDRYFDTNPSAPRGFLLRVTPAGARAWALRYRLQSTGREREVTIGAAENRKLAAAYKRARELRRQIEDGLDPLAEREERRAAPDVKELVDRFIAEELPRGRAPRTQAEYQAMLRDWILPGLARRKVEDIQSEDIEKLHHKITATGKARRANAVKSLCSTIFAKAIAWKMRTDNPAKGVAGNKERGRQRYLKDPELERLLTVLESWRERRRDSVDAIMLAMLTGARRGEILSMRWGDVDLEEGIWLKPAELTKGRDEHRLPLSAAVVTLLRQREAELSVGGKVAVLRNDSAPVFRGAGSKTHTNRLEAHWRELRAEAGLTDLRFHDLRHSAASWAISSGLSLAVVGGLLGHRKSATTEIYAHLNDQALRQGAEAIAGKVGLRK
jgi:integrase